MIYLHEELVSIFLQLRHAQENVILMINAEKDCYAISVSWAKRFQGVLEMVMVIPGTIVMTQLVHVTCLWRVTMMDPQQTYRLVQ